MELSALTSRINGAERRLATLSERYGHVLLRLGLGAVLFWFGALKFFPGLSPADVLAERTIEALTFGVIGGDTARVLLATLETLIGAALLLGRFPRLALAALLGQMAGTLTPLALFPDEMWRHPFVPTMEGQYILKNMVLIAAALALVAWAVRPRLRAVRVARAVEAARPARVVGHVSAPVAEAGAPRIVDSAVREGITVPDEVRVR